MYKLNVTIVDCGFLQFNINPRYELPCTFSTATAFKFIWENRTKRKVSSFSLKAEVEGRTDTLLKSKFAEAANIVADALKSLPKQETENQGEYTEYG